MNATELIREGLFVQTFLEAFDLPAAEDGAASYENGRVVNVTCTRPGREYVAWVLDTAKYSVSLCYDQSDGWEGHCTCAIGVGCKHIFAAMLAISKRGKPSPRDRVSLRAQKAGRSGLVKRAIQKPVTPEPPSSPLKARLAETLGRALTHPARAYVRVLQTLFASVQHGRRSLTPQDLRLLAQNFNAYGWEPLDLWPKPPTNDLELWLYCAWELRRRGIAIPDFMLPVTDLDAIEPQMRSWEREKEISRWRASLDAAHTAGPTQAADPIDLRIVLGPLDATVEWRASPTEPFKELKQIQARRLLHTHLDGSLLLVPESASLWLSLQDPYHQSCVCKLAYKDIGARRTLNRVLRLPGLADRVVTERGEPLARPVEPLRFELLPAETEVGDYRLRLVRHDGSMAPALLLTLPGSPTLYLSSDALNVGPPSHGFGESAELTIPAPAIETSGGLSFITSLGLGLPPRLIALTRQVEVKVKIFCDLKPVYFGSVKESMFVRVVAEFEKGRTEDFTPQGWRPSFGAQLAEGKGKAVNDGLIPVLDRSAQHHVHRLLEAIGVKWEQYSDGWRVKITKDFPEAFIAWLASFPSNVEAHLDAELASLRCAPLSGRVRLDVEEAGVDWFDLKVVLDLADTELAPDELKLLLNARGRYVRLGKKGWRRLEFNLTQDEDERLARLGLDARDFTAEPQRLHALQLADEGATRLLPAQQVEKIQRRVGELKARVAPQMPEAIRAELRPYQIEGFHFLAYLTANRFGGVLADDMGLGKTLQTLTWLAWLRSEALAADAQNPAKPSLVICPKSVMDNWHAEADRFLPGLRVRLWRGEDVAALAEARQQSDLIVMNYSQLRALSPDIAQMRWHTAILDEAQYIKNPDSQTAQVARALQADHRLALTGTPIENRLLDLWSILAYAMPGVLGNRAQFTRKFNAADDPLARRRLAARVRPFLLRRTKNQVAKDLPDRIEEDLLCELEGEQKTLYRAEFKRAQQLLLKVQTRQELNENRFNVLTSLLRLRQICCHPALVNGSLRKAESAKVNALVDLLEPLMEEGHKVLVFSQFVSMLDLLKDTVKQHEWQHFYLAGETENRGELVKEFQKAKGSAVFLISLKAGGFGLNLTAASYVVLFDPWWNPAVENQAIDRTHRIGQTSKVIAYRLLMKNSIEEKIRKLQKTKAALAGDVLGEETFSKSLTLDDLRFLFAEE